MHRIVLAAPRALVRGVATGLALLALGGLGAPGPAAAQPYGYDAPPPPPPGARRGVPTGFNCEAPQPGAFGPRPYSCPLPGARPLGARCFCNLPVAAFSGPQPPLVGSVVP